MIVTTGGSSSSAPPVGAHESGLIGEDSRGARNSRQLAPFVLRVAIGRRKQPNVWDGDYNTPLDLRKTSLPFA